MLRQTELEILAAQLERASEQAKEMKFEHLQFLLSMAFTEARAQLSVARPPLKLVADNDTQGQTRS
ncbi:MAG TPA: hypothetical protein VE865_04475 [Bradyrhizobium sp.]|nr:hypothetical protein [Bradyrhizobium sp.]